MGQLNLAAVTLQMVSRTHSTDSPGLMMVSTGWSFGRHTHDGVRWSGTHMSLSVLGRGRLFTVPSSLFFYETEKPDGFVQSCGFGLAKFSLKGFFLLFIYLFLNGG